MAVEGIGNLLLSPADQLIGQALGASAGGTTPGTGNLGNASIPEDTFTPSAGNNSAQAAAQDAALFQIRHLAPTAITANALFAIKSPDANQNGAPAQAASAPTGNAGNEQPATATNSNAPVNAGQLFPPSSATQSAPVKVAPTTNVQEQIQALNAALPALGLSKEEIQEIDHLASQIQNFNPAAYTNLVNQFEAQAHPVEQQSTPNAPANANTVASKETTANGGSSQV